ncbi:MAG: CHAT domain-containing protein, partial [Planctomycetota bacterium]|nr:CHAT domain-containing protein [Planctomycetota bacterium]
AARIWPDRWETADTLCVHRRRDVALAFARAMPEPEGPRLLAYLTARGEAPPHAEVRVALAQARQALEAPEPAALDVADRTLAAVARQGDDWEQARVALVRGLLARQRGLFAAGLEQLGAAAEQAEALGWYEGAASGFLRAGFCALALDDVASTREAWERHRSVEAARGSFDGEAGALGNLGGLAGEVGDYPAADARLTDAFVLLQRLEASQVGDALRDVLLNLAEVAKRRGRWALALERLDAALRLVDARSAPEAAAFARRSEAELAVAVGDVERALRTYDASEALYASLAAEPGLPPDRVQEIELSRLLVRAGRGRALMAAGQLDEARTLFAGVAPALVAAGGFAAACRAFDNLGVIELAAGHVQPAREAFEAALASATRADDRRAVVNATQNLADAHLAAGDVERASSGHRDALREARSLDAPLLVADAHAGLARVALARGHAGTAFSEAQAADEALRGSLAGLSTVQSPGARERYAAIYETALGSAVVLKDAGKVAWAIEQGRAAALLLALQGREEIRDAVVPAGLLREERAAEREIAESRWRIARAQATGDLKRQRDAKEALELAEDRKRKAVDQVLLAAPLAANMLHGRVDALAATRQRLAAGDVLVSFGYTETNLIALRVTPAGAGILDLGPRAAIEDALDSLVLNDPDTPVDAQAEQLLQLRIVKPLSLAASDRRVIVSPAGRLAYVPWPILFGERETFNVPSATTLAGLAARGGARGRGVLGVGAPNYTGRERGLTPLPHAEAELKGVATRALLADEATEAAVRAIAAEGQRWRAVHFACHATVDREHPLRGALALTRSADGADDGYLTALEVLRLPLQADLTILSACATGRGRVLRGEGLVGLPSSFLAAGSDAVLVSLWKVDDEATAALMQAFHRLWNASDEPAVARSASQALARAQATVRADPRWAHPYYWAAWVQWGNPR